MRFGTSYQPITDVYRFFRRLERPAYVPSESHSAWSNSEAWPEADSGNVRCSSSMQAMSQLHGGNRHRVTVSTYKTSPVPKLAEISKLQAKGATIANLAATEADDLERIVRRHREKDARDLQQHKSASMSLYTPTRRPQLKSDASRVQKTVSQKMTESMYHRALLTKMASRLGKSRPQCSSDKG